MSGVTMKVSHRGSQQVFNHIHGADALAEDHQLLLVFDAVLEQVLDSPHHAAAAVNCKGCIAGVRQRLLVSFG